MEGSRVLKRHHVPFDAGAAGGGAHSIVALVAGGAGGGVGGAGAGAGGYACSGDVFVVLGLGGWDGGGGGRNLSRSDENDWLH